MDPQAACVMVDLSLPTGEEYLAGRWHYGPERLEVALRNFFGAELQGMRIVVAVVAPDHVRVVVLPHAGHTRRGERLPLPGWLMSIPWRSSTRHVCIWTSSFS